MESNQTQSYSYLNDHYMRRELAADFRWFCIIYLSHHFKLEPAPFHATLSADLSNHAEKFLEIIGFRGSAKTTFGSMALILWSALEHPELYPFIIPVSDTSTQSKLNMANIKTELDNNWLIRNDYGTLKSHNFAEPNPEPDLESDEDWQAQNILLESGVRIMCRSRGQKVRGMKHREHRPKLIVVDDPEDREWVRTKENRDKTDQWMRGEVIPARDPQAGRIIVIGNWLHEDALMARLKKTGIFHVKEFALIENGACTWPGLYPTAEALQRERQMAGEIAWRREYLLQIVAEEGQVVTERDITFYDGLVPGDASITGHGVDLAISKESSADSTVDVMGDVIFDDTINRSLIYIRPNPLNSRLNFLETMQHCIAQSKKGGEQMFFVEDVQYQKAAIETLINAGVPVTAMRPNKDKRARLIVAAAHIKNGTVRFPRHGCEDLLAQLYGFGVESHDDLCLIGKTKVITSKGEIPIKDIRIGDSVLTRKGFKKVLWAGTTGMKEVIKNIGITGTHDHPVFIADGTLKYLQDVKASDMLYIWNKSKQKIEIRSYIEAKNITVTRAQNDDNSGFTIGRTPKIKNHLTLSIETCISMHTDRFLEACMSIIKTAIHSTMISPTSDSLVDRSMPHIICHCQIEKRNQPSLRGKINHQQKHGMLHQKVSNGIQNMEKNSGKIQNNMIENANDAAGSSKAITSIQDSAQPHACNMKAIKRGVYNLLIEDEHEFFANGILVHNCDGLAYLISGLASYNLSFAPIQGIDLPFGGRPPARSKLPTDPLNQDDDEMV